MIDVHTHILPHIDDGAKDTATAIKLLEMEMAQGVKTIVLTPHFYGRKRSPQSFLDERKDCFARLKEVIPQGIEVRLGAEVHFTGINVPEYDDLAKLAIQGTKYILLELPFTSKWTGELLDKVADILADTEYTPIIAHIERYDEVLKKPSIVTDLVNMGCLIQVNAQAFLEKQEQKFAFALLKNGLVHCIGSDAHDALVRKPCFLEAKAVVEKAGYLREWERAQEIMQYVLDGEKVSVSYKKEIKKTLFGYK